MAIEPRRTPERRVEERVPFTEHLRILKPSVLHGTGADISAKGICIQIPQTIAEGTAVELELFGGTAFVKGTVKKAAPGIRGFRIGIEFQAEQPALLAKAKAARR